MAFAAHYIRLCDSDPHQLVLQRPRTYIKPASLLVFLCLSFIEVRENPLKSCTKWGTYSDKMLTDQKVKVLKPKEKQYKVYDEKGLYLLVKPNAGKYWRFKYRFTNKKKSLAIGVYPDVSLKKARLSQG